MDQEIMNGELASYSDSKGLIYVDALAMEPLDNYDIVNRPIDDDFVVYMNYGEQSEDGVLIGNRNMVFRLKRPQDITSSDLSLYNLHCDFFMAALGWVESLGIGGGTIGGDFDDDDVALFGATVDVVVDALEELVRQVRTLGRKSLSMIVEICVLIPNPPSDHLDDRIDVEVVEEDETMIEVEDEEDAEKLYEWAEEILKVSGTVKFMDIRSYCSDKNVASPCDGCTICLDEFKYEGSVQEHDYMSLEDHDQMVVALLTCSHALHSHCLIPWILKCRNDQIRPSCPLCRCDLLAPFFMEE